MLGGAKCFDGVTSYHVMKCFILWYEVTTSKCDPMPIGFMKERADRGFVVRQGLHELAREQALLRAQDLVTDRTA